MSSINRSVTKGSDRDTSTRGGGWKNSVMKNYGVAAIGEFLGTFLFLFFAFAGTQCVKLAYDPLKENQNDPASAFATAGLLIYVAMCFGVSLAVNVWIFYRVSGGIFNPAVTLGVVLLGGMPVLKGGILAIAQLLGGIVAAGAVEAILPGPLSVNTGLGGGISVAQGFFLEAFLTFELTLTIYMLAVEKHRATFLAPIGIGLALFISQLAGVYFTGGSLNPARSFGPAVITGVFPKYHWIYWLGPCLGSVAASGFYKLLLIIEYRSVNPDQDTDGIDRYTTYSVGGGLDRGRASGSVTEAGDAPLRATDIV
ncbi:aquaporin 1 [Peziza echinospora]|nr:aquaporin 1 [Peziza echinospora]